MRIGTLAPVITLVAGVALTGCGSSTPSSELPGNGQSSAASSSTSPKLLTSGELKAALITLDDLGPHFKVDTSKDSSDEDMGCLSGLDKLDKAGTQPVRDEEVSFAARTELKLPGVFNTVGTFRTPAKAAKTLTEFSDAIKGCTKVDVTDKDGARIQLTVSSDQQKTDADATGQINFDASGTITVQHLHLPFSFRFSAIQVGNQVALVGYVNMAEKLGQDADAVEQRAYDRLAPIAAGDKAPDLDPLTLKIASMQDLVGGASTNA